MLRIRYNSALANQPKVKSYAYLSSTWKNPAQAAILNSANRMEVYTTSSYLAPSVLMECRRFLITSIAQLWWQKWAKPLMFPQKLRWVII